MRSIERLTCYISVFRLLALRTMSLSLPVWRGLWAWGQRGPGRSERLQVSAFPGKFDLLLRPSWLDHFDAKRGIPGSTFLGRNHLKDSDPHRGQRGTFVISSASRMCERIFYSIFMNFIFVFTKVHTFYLVFWLVTSNQINSFNFIFFSM